MLQEFGYVLNVKWTHGAGMQDFKKLEVWQLAHQLTLDLFRVCDRRFSRYPSLRSQALRASQSIGSNIAEGTAGTDPEFARFLDHSLRSAKEVENDLLLARDLHLMRIDEFELLEARLTAVRRRLIALIRRLRTD
jgi:four helix bundle protein